MEQWERDVAKMAKTLRKIAAIEVPRGSSAALTKVAALSKTQVKKGVSTKTKIPQKHIGKKVFIRKSTARTQVSQVDVYRDGVSLVSVLTPKNIKNRTRRSFHRRKNRPQIKWKGRSFTGAFVAKVSFGRRDRRSSRTRRKTSIGQPQVFEREGEDQSPIEAVKIPIKKEVAQVSGVVIGRVMKSEFPRLLKHEMEYRLSKYETK